jgi:hypothetical protein
MGGRHLRDRQVCLVSAQRSQIAGAGEAYDVSGRSPGRRPLAAADVMNAAEVADLLRVSRSTVEDWPAGASSPRRRSGDAGSTSVRRSKQCCSMSMLAPLRRPRWLAVRACASSLRRGTQPAGDEDSRPRLTAAALRRTQRRLVDPSDKLRSQPLKRAVLSQLSAASPDRRLLPIRATHGPIGLQTSAFRSKKIARFAGLSS